MELVDIYTLAPVKTRQFLYDMLKDRPPVSNISHKTMPTFEEHCAFVSSRPYEAWYIILDDDEPVGNIYLSKQNEIGVFIEKSAQGRGFGLWAVQEVMRIHGPRRYLANIAPANARSQELFAGLDFKLVQYTFEKDTRC